MRSISGTQPWTSLCDFSGQSEAWGRAQTVVPLRMGGRDVAPRSGACHGATPFLAFARKQGGGAPLILAFVKHRLPGYLDYHFNAIDTADVGVGHVRAATHERLGERYLLTQQQLTLKEIATLVAHAAGVAPPRWRIPHLVALSASCFSEGWGWLTRTEPLLPRSAVQMARVGQQLDGTKAIQELSLPQTPIEEAIRRAVAWFKQYGYLH